MPKHRPIIPERLWYHVQGLCGQSSKAWWCHVCVWESGLYLASNRCNQVCAVHNNVCSVFWKQETSITKSQSPGCFNARTLSTYPFPLQSIPWICFLNDKGPKSQFAAATSPLDMTRPGSLLGWNLLALAPGAELSTPGPGITPVSPASSISVSGLILSFSPRLII